jgi:hypothetical protein
MNLLIYSNATDGAAKRLRDAVGRLGLGIGTENFEAVSDLAGRIRKGKRDVAAVVLCACTREEFEEIFAIRDLLLDLRTILILPDRESGVLARGLTMRPRFFSFADAEGDYGDVSAVLARMLEIYGKEPGWASVGSAPLREEKR